MISFSSKISRLQIIAYVSVRISGGSSILSSADLPSRCYCTCAISLFLSLLILHG